MLKSSTKFGYLKDFRSTVRICAVMFADCARRGSLLLRPEAASLLRLSPLQSVRRALRASPLWRHKMLFL